MTVAAAVVASMTGFGRAEGHDEGIAWTIEVRSVNNRGLDIRCRVPAGYEAVEALARTELPKRIKRGGITLNITFTRPISGGQVRINRDLLAQVLAVARELEGAGAAPPRLDALLTVRGVIEVVEESVSESREALSAALATGLSQSLDRIIADRAAEGTRLTAVLAEQVNEISRLTEAATRTAAARPETLAARLRGSIAALLEAVPGSATLPEERLAQELALLIQRGDVREELDRLRSHVAAARDLLAEGGSIGRRLDFLCQEFNREANTLCAKSSDTELTRIGLALKASIEQFREQTQNIE
ncbi:conserved hypothetical protein [uncultured Gammaproteobacteria bacterium]